MYFFSFIPFGSISIMNNNNNNNNNLCKMLLVLHYL